ncbi:hypothetical protein FRC17_000689 [Serendipita sp. 399]|nr:hypothetical protein FRC17_000689 [Serendipita sp. 399]
MKSTFVSLFTCLILLLEAGSIHALPMNPSTSGGTTTPGTTTPGTTTPGTTGGGRAPAAPITPHANLKTYISTTLKGHGKKELDAEVPASAKAFLKTTTANVAAFDKEVNAFVTEEVKAEKALAARLGPDHDHRTPELAYTDKIMKLSVQHNVGFIAPCKDERKTGGDLICAMHVEHVLPGGKVRKIFAVVQMKVAQQFKNLAPVVDFMHKNPNGLQVELLAQEVIKKRGELAPDVDVLGAYGATDEDELVFLPLDEILQHYEGATVDPSQPKARQVTTDLFKEHKHGKGFLQSMLDYVEAREKK